MFLTCKNSENLSEIPPPGNLKKFSVKTNKINVP